MTDIKDFIIEANRILKYRGSEIHVVIPKSACIVYANAFFNSNIESVIIPRSIKKLGTIVRIGENGTFENCKKLKKVIIEGDSLEIDKKVFSGCD